MEAQTETTSRNSVLKRDALSEWRSKRKPCPGIQPQSGTPFPAETTCLDIDLRPLLQGVDGLIHVEQVSHNAETMKNAGRLPKPKTSQPIRMVASSVLVALPKTAA